MSKGLIDKVMLSVLLWGGIILCLTIPAEAGVNQWTTSGPSGGRISDIAIDPATPSTLYASTYYTGVFKSTNGGADWVEINSSLTNTNINDLAIDPATPTTLYAGASNGTIGVFKSTDGGATWSASSSGIPVIYGTSTVLSLAIDPATPNTIYAGVFYGGVYKSTDGGANWSASGIGGQSVYALAVDPVTPTTLYAGTITYSGAGGVYKSTNGGTTWTLINSGLTDIKINDIAIDPSTPTTLYVATNTGGVFKSTDGGANWGAVNSGLPGSPRIKRLAIDPASTTSLYAGDSSNGGIYKSTNGGSTWVAINAGSINRSIYAIGINPSTSDTVYAGTEVGIFKSLDGGTTWTASSNGIFSLIIRALAIDPLTPNILYAGIGAGGYSGGGVHKSTDGGASWAMSGLANHEPRALAIDPASPNTIYAATTVGVFKSTDGGATWAASSSGMPYATVNALAVDPVTPNILYAGTYNYGIYKSTDGGANWAASNSGLTNLSPASIAVDPLTPSTVYAGTYGGGAFKSTDSGATWTAINSGLASAYIRKIAVDPSTPDTVYIGDDHSNGIFKSTDGGATWTYSGLYGSSIYGIEFDTDNPGTLYAGRYGDGVYVSTDSGATWSAMNNGLGDLYVHALVIDPVNTNILHAGTFHRSVWSIKMYPEADLSITKSDGVTSAVPGQSVTYSIVATNNGPSDDPSVGMADAFPSSLTCTYTSVASGGATGNTASGSGDIADTLNMPSGSSVTYTATCSIDPSATGTLSNTATVTGSVTDPNGANNSATDSDTLTPEADLSITKSDGVTSAVPGQSVTYSIVATNSGPSDDPSVSMADTFPSSLTCTYTSVASGGATGNTASGSGDIADTLNMPSGSSVTYTATCSIDPSATGTLSNTATATSSVADPAPGNNSATDSDTLTPEADLSITKDDGLSTVVAGESLTYTISVGNAGPSDVTGVTVTDTFPAELNITGVSCLTTGGATCSATGTGDINDTVDLPVGGTVTYTVNATLDANATGTLSNTASLTAPGGVTDPDTGNNTSTDTDTVISGADLSVVKADNADPVQQGGDLTYTITVTNNGPGNATGVTLTDPLPAGLTSPSATVTQGSCNIASGTVTCNIGSISSGATVTVTVSATAPSSTGDIFNTATVTSSSTDPDSSNDSDTERTTIVTSAAMIALPRTGQTFLYEPGDDGEIQAGMKWPLTRFRDRGNGIMFDRLTGLGWLQDGNCMATRYPGADTDGTVGDGKVSWQNALSFVAGVNSGAYPDCGGGMTGWRLANVNEIESLFNAGMANSSAWLEGWGFVNVAPSYWTSTTFASDTGSAWVMNVRKGKVIKKTKGLYFTVILVRGTSYKRSIVWQTGQKTVDSAGDDGDIQAGASWPAPRFMDNGDGTVTDKLTGLVWTQNGKSPGPSGCTPGVKKDWPGALAFIDCLNTSNYLGRQDWRLANRKELRSLIDYGASSTAGILNTSGFVNVRPVLYWTSTTLMNDDTKAWTLRLDTGLLMFKPKTGTYLVWPVSGRVSP